MVLRRITVALILLLTYALSLAQIGGPVVPTLHDFGQCKYDLLNNIEATTSSCYWGTTSHKLPLVEYIEDLGGTNLVAYRRGADIDVEITYKNYIYNFVGFTFTPKRARIACPGQVQRIGEFWTQPVENIELQVVQEQQGPYWVSLGNTQKVTFKIRNVPNYVAVGDLQIGYDLPCTSNPEGQFVCENGTRGGYAPLCRLYLLLENPTGLQSTPWLDLTEYSCRWAFGATDTATTYEKMVDGIHHGGRAPQRRVKYDPGQPLFLRVRQNGTTAYSPVKIDISAWYEKFGFPSGTETSYVSLMCDDVSTLLWTSLESQGIASYTSIISVPNQSFMVDGLPVSLKGYMVTQPLKPAGPPDPGSSSNDYEQKNFSYHSTVYGELKHYDASSSYAYTCYGSPWLECDKFGWPDPYYFHNGSVVPNGGLAWEERWVVNTSTDVSSNSAGWVDPYIQYINPTAHIKE